MGFRKIDKSMGESRVSQVAGGILLVALFVTAFLYKLYAN